MVTPNLTGRNSHALPRTPGVPQPQVGDGNPATCPADTDARERSARNEVEDALHFVKNLSGLAEWIERARELCEAVSIAARATPDLADVLRVWKIAYSDADWDEVTSAGLRALHMVIERRAGDALVALTGEVSQ